MVSPRTTSSVSPRAGRSRQKPCASGAGSSVPARRADGATDEHVYGVPASGARGSHAEGGRTVRRCRLPTEHMQPDVRTMDLARGSCGPRERRRRGFRRQARQAVGKQQRALPRSEQSLDPSAAKPHFAARGGQRGRGLGQSHDGILERTACAHGSGGIEQEHVGVRVLQLDARTRDTEPQHGRDREQKQVRRQMPEAPKEHARAPLLRRLTPEQRRHHPQLTMAHAQPLQRIQGARQREQAGADKPGGQSEAHTASRPPSNSAASCASTGCSTSRRSRPAPRSRANAASPAWNSSCARR